MSIILNSMQVFVKYTGRLAHNQKIFDSNITQKKPFMFRLGQGEVIKGWDEGVNGITDYCTNETAIIGSIHYF